MTRKKQTDHIPFDTLSYAKRLQTAGFTREQAEIQAETFLDIVQDQLVSKQDFSELEIKIEEIRKELKLDIETVRKDLSVAIENIRKDLSVEIENVKKEIHQLDNKTQAHIELLRRDLKIWFGGMLVVAVSVLSGTMTLVAYLTH